MSWKTVPGYMPGIYNVYDDENNPVAIDCTKDRAVLIAAAPKLLDALETLHYLVSEVANPNAFDNGVYAPNGKCEGEVLAGNIIEQARIIIIKAGGTTT